MKPENWSTKSEVCHSNEPCICQSFAEQCSTYIEKLPGSIGFRSFVIKLILFGVDGRRCPAIYIHQVEHFAPAGSLLFLNKVRDLISTAPLFSHKHAHTRQAVRPLLFLLYFFFFSRSARFLFSSLISKVLFLLWLASFQFMPNFFLFQLIPAT